MTMQDRDKLARIAALVLTIVIYLRYSNRHSAPLPPGPKKLPILGNLLNAPRSYAWRAYADWGRNLGSDILYLDLAGQPVIVLNSISAANELLDKRSSVYSSRPHFIMMVELMGWGWALPSMPYGDRWRERRKLFTQYFHPKQVESSIVEVRTEFIRKMLIRLYEDPGDFLAITRYAIGGMALSLAYGIAIEKKNDPYLALSKATLHKIAEAAIPGTSISWTLYLH